MRGIASQPRGIARLARALGLDSNLLRRASDRDVDSGIASGEVLGTPTLFIDGAVHRGSYDPATLLSTLSR